MKTKNDYQKFNIFINIWIAIFVILFIIFAIYFAINGKKNQNTLQTEVNSEETVRFKLNGEKEMIIYVGNEFKDPGFKVESNINGDISSYVEIEGDVNTEIPDTYKIIYTLNYKSINPKQTRTIIVKEKNENNNVNDNSINENIENALPSSKENEEVALYLNGGSSIAILKGSEYQEKGAKAINKKGKDVSKNIKITGEVNSDVVGTYKVTYSITDSKKRTVKLTRTITVLDINATITSSKKSYTNENISLNIAVNADKFSHIILPNGQKITTNNYTYEVSENGKYAFDIYNTENLGKRYTYIVKNIDKTNPTGSCEVIQNTKEVYLTVNANDNVGIKKYVYNNKNYTTNKISTSEIITPTIITIYDQANNQTQITCKNENPIINNITKDGVIITVESKKAAADIAGYYFSYDNKLPDKNTGGYLATNLEKVDLVRLAGTTYVWVEDKDGKISAPRTITIDNSALLLTRASKYKKLENISLEKYLKNKGWSLTELNNLIIRSVRGAGLYSQEAAATAAVALQTVLAQKYNIKLPYWWGGKSWEIGADKSWGIYKTKYAEKYDNTYYYYGLDCSGFTTWAYVNAGYNIKRGQYPGFWGSSTKLTKDNGKIGDFLVEEGHTTIIVGKTDKGYIKAEAAGKGPGMVLTLHPYTKTSGYYITKGSMINNKYPKMNKSSYPSGF